MTLKEIGLNLISERKVAVFASVLVTLLAAFIFAALRPSANDPFKTLAEWVVYLAAAFFGGNALTYFGKGKPDAK